MDGKIMVTYKILCSGDFNKEISIDELILNEKIAKVIKSEFAKGFRNISMHCKNTEAKLKIETEKEIYSFEVDKDDFADILVLAEENATSRKLFKKDCERVELVDIETMTL